MIQRHQQSMSRLFGKHWQSGGRLAPVIEYFPFWYRGGITSIVGFDPVNGAYLGRYRGTAIDFPKYKVDNIIFNDYYPIAFVYGDKVFFDGIPFPDLSAHEWFCDNFEIYCFKAECALKVRNDDRITTLNMYVFCISSENVKLESNDFYSPANSGGPIWSPSCKWLVVKNQLEVYKFRFENLPVTLNVRQYLYKKYYVCDFTWDAEIKNSDFSFYPENTSKIILPDVEIPAILKNHRTELRFQNYCMQFPTVNFTNTYAFNLHTGTFNGRTRFTLTPDFSYSSPDDGSDTLGQAVQVQCPSLGFTINDELQSSTTNAFSNIGHEYSYFDIYEKDEVSYLSSITNFRNL